MNCAGFIKTNTNGTLFNVTGNVNNSGTAGYTAMKFNVAENSLGSGINNLIDFQINSVSKFSIDNKGDGTFGGNAKIDSSLLLTTTQHTINGSSSGTVVWSMPFQGSSYKKGVVYFNAMNDAGTSITYPTAFTKTPFVYGASSCTAVATTNTTTLTISATSGVSGFLFIEGY